MAYSLAHSYFGASLVSGFSWFNGVDPSNGFVSYQSQQDALTKGLYSINPVSQAVKLGVDHTNTYPTTPGSGRPSIRLESKEAFNHGLFIGDFSHMPPSVCGLWPAFWAFGPEWPIDGEIDIIEGANTATRNLISAHTSPGCLVPSSAQAPTLGEAISFDCESPGSTNNAGCSYVPNVADSSTYGDTFNAVGGGVYAMEWTSEAIKIWHFPRQSIPTNIVQKRPDPSTWGLPTAIFGTESCDPDTYFRNMRLSIQINFCGDYAGNIWGRQDTCNQLAPTCTQYVASHPEAFTNAYWEVNYIDVYALPVRSNDGKTTTTTIKQTKTQTITVALPNTRTDGGPVSRPTNTPTAGPQSPADDYRGPATIGRFAFLGCFGSDTGFKTFTPEVADPSMTLEKCVVSCSSRKYAGVQDKQCYCADSLDGNTRAISNRGQCDISCPGNPLEFCGGLVDGYTGTTPNNATLPRFRRRDAPANFLLSVYAAITDEVPPPAPALGSPEGIVTVVAVTVTYTTVCPTDPASLIEVEYCASETITYCDYCRHKSPEPMPVPMKTYVEKCDACGHDGEHEVTLTVPIIDATHADWYGEPTHAAHEGHDGKPDGGKHDGGKPNEGKHGKPSHVQVSSTPDLLGLGVLFSFGVVLLHFSAMMML